MTTNEKRRSFTCDDETFEALQRYAAKMYDGNISMAIRSLIKKGLKLKVKL